MHVFYEEDSQFKVGTIVTDNTSSLQIDTQFGKRVKLRANQIMLRFATPSLDEFMAELKHAHEELDVDFLWETAPDSEFSFEELAHDYFGHTPKPSETAAILHSLHQSPMHFYRKGHGRYRAAPVEALTAAKASVVRKQREAAQLDSWLHDLIELRLPTELRDKLDMLLYAPDKQDLAWRALDAACKKTSLSPERFLERIGAIPSLHDYHINVFLREHFPRGSHFSDTLTWLAPDDSLPLSSCPAFSIDDALTTEVDDAFSVQLIDEHRWRIGIHIAAPALAFAPNSELDKIAANRLSTVYHPAGKITLLPEPLINAWSLNEGESRPVVSLYIDVDECNWDILSQYSCVEQITIATNLRHEQLIEEKICRGGNQGSNSDNGSGNDDNALYRELNILWQLSGALEARRGKTPDPAQPPRADYQFRVIDDRISITDRQRGNPVDRLVSELMIYVNTTWGKLLAEHDAIALYRTQSGGKVKMSTRPAPHEGLGVEQYAWSSSPLRRFVDLINQRQLIALLQQEPPPYPPKSEVVYSILRDFELAYDAYATFQRKMERFWCLRWLQQENVNICQATVIKENLVRLDGLPLLTRVPSLPTTIPVGSTVQLHIDRIDLLDVDLFCTHIPTTALAEGE